MNLYAYCHNNPVNFIDPSGTDAMVANRGGFNGHTFFMIDYPDGGIYVYHFYAYGHRNDLITGNLTAVFGDAVDIWSETADSMKDYLDIINNQYAGEGIFITRYAIGTDADDARMISQLKCEEEEDAGVYSILYGRQCHNQSERWFRDYIGYDSLVTNTHIVRPDPSFPYLPPFQISITPGALGENINIINIRR